jgi:GTPase SAR1 family protein
VLFLGLEGAGKTTALYHYLLGEEVTTISTIGLNVETIEAPGKPGAKLTVFEVGGTK